MSALNDRRVMGVPMFRIFRFRPVTLWDHASAFRMRIEVSNQAQVFFIGC